MSLTSVLKPDGFRPVGAGTLIYTFTESSVAGKPNYRVEIEFNGLSTVPVVAYYPNSSLEIECNIAPQLRSVLALSTSSADRLITTYVKYQAKWDGGSDAQVNLSSNVIYAYVGHDNFLNHRTQFEIISSGDFLTGFEKLPVWPDRTAYIEALLSASLSGEYGMLIPPSTEHRPFTFDGPITGGTGQLYSSNFKKSSFNSTIRFAKLGATAITINKTINTGDYRVYLASPDIGDATAQTFTATASGTFRAAFRVKKTGSPTFDIQFRLKGTTAGAPNDADIKTTTTLDLSDLREGVYEWVIVEFDYAITSTVVYAIEITASGGDSSNHYKFPASVLASTYAGGSQYTKSGGVWTNSPNNDLMCGIYQGSQTILASLEIDLKEECDNPIYLRWVNDYGGLSTWLFDQDQLFTLAPEDDGRFKKMGVVVRSLTMAQWSALQELNRSGAEYGDNEKLGAFVQDFTDEDNPVNIFTEADERNTQTKFARHEFGITLRYPIIDNSDL